MPAYGLAYFICWHIVDAETLLGDIGLALEEHLGALLHDVGQAQHDAVGALLRHVGAHGLADLGNHAKRAALVDRLILADEQFAAAHLEELDVVAHHLLRREGTGGTGEEYLHAKLDGVNAKLLAKALGDGGIDGGGGRTLEFATIEQLEPHGSAMI